MPSRCYGQQQHVLQSLDVLVHYLLAISFLLSPAFLPYLTRLLFEFSAPKVLRPEPGWTMPWILGSVVVANSYSIIVHTWYGVVQGPAVILDFIGMDYTPSRLQVLTLDFTIMAIQFSVKIIAYELALDMYTDSSSQLIYPSTSSPSPIPPFASSSIDTETADLFVDDPKNEGPDYIIDLRLSTIIGRIRQPPVVRPEQGPGLPTTAPAVGPLPWGLSTGMMSAVRSARIPPPPPRRAATTPTIATNTSIAPGTTPQT